MQPFTSNVWRLKTLILAPAVSTYFALLVMNLYDRVAVEFTGKVGRYDPTHDAAADPAHQKRFAELLAEEASQNARRALTPDGDACAQKANLQASQVMSLTAETFWDIGFHGMLASYLTSMWTAFETMAADLWEWSLNLHPKHIATLEGSPKDQRMIPLDVARRYDFDLRYKMGTVLRARREPKGLEELRRRYKQAFTKDAEKIHAALDERALAILSATRNLIVHKASKVDDEYLMRTQNLGVPPMTKDELLPLNGEYVANLLGSSVDASFALLRSVDTWLAERQG